MNVSFSDSQLQNQKVKRQKIIENYERNGQIVMEASCYSVWANNQCYETK